MTKHNNDNTPAKTKCPECQRPAVHAYRPFCSKRCADLDLGKWFNEQYVLPGDSEMPDDMEEN